MFVDWERVKKLSDFIIERYFDFLNLVLLTSDQLKATPSVWLDEEREIDVSACPANQWKDRSQNVPACCSDWRYKSLSLCIVFPTCVYFGMLLHLFVL